MLPTPKVYTLVAGSAEGESRLTAFDKALLDAGVGNLNLLKVSSVLPPSAHYRDGLEIAPGSLTPVAYGSLISDIQGEMIAAAVAVGLSPDTFGMIMEFTGKCGRAEAEKAAVAMVEESFRARGLKLAEVKVRGVERLVDRVACVFAAAVLWY